jgi:serine/threonine protein kinase
VKLGVHVTSRRVVALKIIDKQTTRKSIIINLKKEVKALRKLDHPHIVKLDFVDPYGSYPRKWGGFRDVVVLGLEFAEGGTLCEYCRPLTSHPPLPPSP